MFCEQKFYFYSQYLAGHTYYFMFKTELIKQTVSKDLSLFTENGYF